MPGQRFDNDLLRQEVEELTDLLRHEEVLADLRGLLDEAGHDPQKLLLAGFMEDASNFQGGVIITPEKAVYHFERDDSEDHFSKWEQVQDVSVLSDTYPAVFVALKMDVE